METLHLSIGGGPVEPHEILAADDFGRYFGPLNAKARMARWCWRPAPGELWELDESTAQYVKSAQECTIKEDAP